MPPESEATAWYAAVLRAFERAAARLGERRLQLSWGSASACLRSAGDAPLDALSASLTLRAPGDDALGIEVDAALEICAFDSVSSGVPAPPIPAGAELHLVRQELRGLSSPELPIALLQIPDQGCNLLRMYDRARNRALVWTEDAARLPYWVRAAPLLPVLAWWLERPGQQIVHAGAVGDARGALLLVGRSGSGKSSSALASALAGFDYLSDDFCLVRSAPPSVHSLYNAGKLFPQDLQHFPGLDERRLPTEPDAEKVLFRLPVHRPDLPLRAIVLPQVVAHGTSALRPVSAATALRSLAPSSLMYLPNAGAQAFSSLASLTRQVPCFELRIAGPRREVPGLLRGLLEELRHAG